MRPQGDTAAPPGEDPGPVHLSISSFDTMELRWYLGEGRTPMSASRRAGYMAGQLAELKGGYADED